MWGRVKWTKQNANIIKLKSSWSHQRKRINYHFRIIMCIALHDTHTRHREKKKSTYKQLHMYVRKSSGFFISSQQTWREKKSLYISFNCYLIIMFSFHEKFGKIQKWSNHFSAKRMKPTTTGAMCVSYFGQFGFFFCSQSHSHSSLVEIS